MKYGSLNIKSDYSLLKSLIKINDLIEYAKKNNLNVLSLCDNNLCGSLEFYNACKQNNIKCIIGFILVKKGVWLQNIVAHEE